MGVVHGFQTRGFVAWKMAGQLGSPNSRGHQLKMWLKPYLHFPGFTSKLTKFALQWTVNTQHMLVLENVFLSRFHFQNEQKLPSSDPWIPNTCGLWKMMRKWCWTRPFERSLLFSMRLMIIEFHRSSLLFVYSFLCSQGLVKKIYGKNLANVNLHNE